MIKKYSNRAFMQYICEFIDNLFLELLTRRSNLEIPCYLQGLPVTDEELLLSFHQISPLVIASEDLRQRWGSLCAYMEEKEVDKDSPRLLQLHYLYNMNELWLLALILTYAYQLEPKYEKAVLILQGDTGRRAPDVFLVSALANYLGMEHQMEQLRMEGRIRNELFDVLPDGQLALQEYVFLWLKGEENKKLSRECIVDILSADEEQCDIHTSELEWCTTIARRQLDENIEPQLIFELQGRVGAGKKHFSREIVKRLGYQLCVLNMSVLLEHSEKERHNMIQEVYFTCSVKQALLYVDLNKCREDSRDVLHWTRKVLSEYFLIFIGVEPKSNICQSLSLQTKQIFLDNLSLKDSLSIWKWMGEKHLVEDGLNYEELAGKYRLLPGTIKEIFTRAERCRFEKQMPEIDFSLLLSSIRESNQVISNTLMERINTVFQWKDLRVEPQVIQSMQLACAHLKYRFKVQESMGNWFPYGGGVGVLMYGPPGTGKTMAAQVIANELQMDLYRVDISQVSSKYIGETEKNLEQIFREAEQANVILFFDEADSMFGKRTEVKDSNDKYANQETSYILQRIESYEGMVILATNFAQNFDSAFMRRITVSIRFSLPDEEIRKLLWQDMLRHSELAKDTVMIEALSTQFELSGSNIKNIVRNAEYLALMKQRKLDISDVVMGIKYEFEKQGKICNAASFGMFLSYIYE